MSGSTCIRHQLSPSIISALTGATTSQVQNLTREFKPSLRHRIHLRNMQGTTARHHSRCKIFCDGLERLFPSVLLQAPAKSRSISISFVSRCRKCHLSSSLSLPCASAQTASVSFFFPSSSPSSRVPMVSRRERSLSSRRPFSECMLKHWTV
jgi:hypothetical protein